MWLGGGSGLGSTCEVCMNTVATGTKCVVDIKIEVYSIIPREL